MQKEKTMEEKIKAVLEGIRPDLQNDGGDVEFVSLADKTVTLKLVGHCGECPYAMMTLKNRIEAELRAKVDPELVVERLPPARPFNFFG